MTTRRQLSIRARLPALLLALACTAAQAQGIKAVTEASSYNFLQDGKVSGPATEVVRATLLRAGLNEHRFNLYPWARAYDMAQNEPNVLIYLIARTPAREGLFKWTGEFLRIDYHLYKLRERRDIVVRELQDAKHYTLGVVRNDVRQQHLQEQGFTRMAVTAQNSDSFQRLLNRQVDLIPMSERDMALLCKEAGIPFSSLEKVFTLKSLSTNLYMAYSNATPDDIVARTRTAFQQLKAEGVVDRLMKDGR